MVSRNANGTLHITLSRKDGEARRVLFCPTCNRRRRMYGWFQHWYGWTVTCLGCGDRWSGDGEMAERPFKPRWRAERIAEARLDWARAVPRKPDFSGLNS